MVLPPPCKFGVRHSHGRYARHGPGRHPRCRCRSKSQSKRRPAEPIETSRGIPETWKTEHSSCRVCVEPTLRVMEGLIDVKDRIGSNHDSVRRRLIWFYWNNWFAARRLLLEHSRRIHAIDRIAA